MRASVVLCRDANCTVACVETKERQSVYDPLAAKAAIPSWRNLEGEAVEIDGNYVFVILPSIRYMHYPVLSAQL